MSLKQEYSAFIAKVRKDGGRLLNFPCPCCQEDIETLAAPGEAIWDTLATCPHCEGVFIKVVTATQVETTTLDGEM
ncbi:TPA: hypothetical protein ACGQTY_002517 [Citrobacter farmeri]|uniref:Uncharacterized protein n=1 Tax=Citrobacter amalonaticus TaxID=35703 RepID=A0AAX2BE89_CITAM|nr:hypothetical protein [Citrobacter amalonaticus]QZA35388.1 hypothetical protein K1713_17330 [Citrobacter amalonaticus]SAZ04260.1 conserved protein of unknown function [Citrobacter amalonaticus]